MTTTEGALMKKTEYILFTCTVPFPCVDKFSRICSFLKQHPLYNVQCCIPDGLNDQDRRLFLRFKKNHNLSSLFRLICKKCLY